VSLPPGVNPIAVDKYIYLSIYPCKLRATDAKYSNWVVGSEGHSVPLNMFQQQNDQVSHLVVDETAPHIY